MDDDDKSLRLNTVLFGYDCSKKKMAFVVCGCVVTNHIYKKNLAQYCKPSKPVFLIMCFIV